MRKDAVKFEDLPDVLTARDVAEFFNVSPAMVYKAVREGRIPAIKFGKKIRISKNIVNRILTEGSFSGEV